MHPSDKTAPSDSDPFGGIEEERRKKIAKIKQAIAEGTYYISADAVAEKLIEHMREQSD